MKKSCFRQFRHPIFIISEQIPNDLLLTCVVHYMTCINMPGFILVCYHKSRKSLWDWHLSPF